MNARLLKNQSGQGLIEYIILITVICVGSVTVTRVLGKQINHKIAQVSDVLAGKKARDNSTDLVTRDQLKKKDLGNFFRGANSESKDKD